MILAESSCSLLAPWTPASGYSIGISILEPAHCAYTFILHLLLYYLYFPPLVLIYFFNILLLLFSLVLSLRKGTVSPDF
jgi:hypothetical protein